MKEILMSSVFCIKCHMPASIDAEKLCEFCRRRTERVEARTNDAQQGLGILAAVIGVAALVWWFL